jgi:hypothetical protein
MRLSRPNFIDKTKVTVTFPNKKNFNHQCLIKNMGGLTCKYSGKRTNFTKEFKDFFTCLDRLFKKDVVFQANHKKISLLDYLKAMFSFKHPNSLCIEFLNKIPDILKINFTGKVLNQDQVNFLKTFFSKGLFNEFRTKMALILLQASNKITSFVQTPSFGKLDCQGKIDFLIQTPETTDKKAKVFGIQVKSSEAAIKRCPHDRKIYVNAHNKSLTEIADSIKFQISKENTNGIEVSRFTADTSTWLDTVIRHFSPRSQSA